MIKTLLLRSFIKKYHLSGKTEGVIWKITPDKKLSVDFSPTVERELIGKIEYKNFIDTKNEIQAGIFSTSQLLKITSLLENEIDIEFKLNPKNYQPLKIFFKDSLFTTSYSVADQFIIPQPGKLKTIPDFSFEFDLSPHMSNLVKAKQALPDESNIVHLESTGTGDLIFTFGGTLEHTNKIKYAIKDIPDNVFKFNFCINSELFKHILSENTDMNSFKMMLNINGLICLEFENEDIKSTYYLVRKSEN